MVLGDCDRGYGIPAYSVCSGNGVCEPATNKCICKKDWSSFADFQVKDGVDCDIHLPTILSFACISFAASFVGAALCLFALYKTGLKKTNGSYSKQIKIIAFLFNFLGVILQSALKIYDTEKHIIGSSAGSAIGFIMFTWPICVGYSYFIEELVTFLLKSCSFIEGQNSSIGLDTKLSFIKRFSNVPPTIGFIAVIFIILTEADPTRGDLYVIGYIGALLSVLLINSLVLLSFFPIFIEEMSKLIAARPDAPENVRIKEIHYETSIQLKLIQIFFITIAPPMILFMSWHFMRRKYTYFLWFALMNASTVASIVCFFFIPKSSRVGLFYQNVQNSIPPAQPSADVLPVIIRSKPSA